MLNQAARATAIVWDPRKKQSADLDTTFGPLDPAVETTRSAPIATGAAGGNRADLGGFILGDDASAPSIVPGKYRQAIQPTSSSSFIWSPLDGMLPTGELTIEQLVTADADWSTLTLQSWGAGNTDNWSFSITGGNLTVKITHGQNPANLTYSLSAVAALSPGRYAAGTAYSVAATLTQAGVLTLYLEAAQVAQATGFVAPLSWWQTARQDGLIIPSGASTHLTIEGLKISRKARTPLVKQARPTGRNTIVVGSTPTGVNVAALNGITKPITGSTKAPLIPTAIATARSQNAISVERTGKLMSTTPILAGGTPDATHPTVGQSGLYCYDWQIVDRTLDEIVNRLGAIPYISIGDSIPSILGGAAVPFTSSTWTTIASGQQPDVTGSCTVTVNVGTLGANNYFTAPIVGGGTNLYYYNLRGGFALQQVVLVSGTPGATVPAGSAIQVGSLKGFAYTSTFNAGPPNNITSFAHMCADFVYHIRTELGYTTAAFGVSNEPDGGVNWEAGGTAQSDWLAMWAAIFSAVKAVAPSVMLGGPETIGTTWVQALINYGADNACYPDFVSYHDYGGGLGSNIPLQIAAWAAAKSKPTPPMVIGEWGWQSANTGFSPGFGKFPWMQPAGGATSKNPPPTPQPGRCDYAANSFNAAFHAVKMILNQQVNGLGSSYAPYLYMCDFTGNDTSLFDASAVPQTLYNVMRMWGMIKGGQVLPITSDDLPPGVRRLAVKVGSQWLVLLASLHYRKTRPNGASTHTISVDVSAGSFANGTNVSVYTTDDLTANAYDTQGATSTMTPTTTSVQGGKVSVNIRMQAVRLLVIG